MMDSQELNELKERLDALFNFSSQISYAEGHLLPVVQACKSLLGVSKGHIPLGLLRWLDCHVKHFEPNNDCKFDLNAKGSIELLSTFELENISNAFDQKLFDLLIDIDKTKVPSNYSDFYQMYSVKNETKSKKIKFNNKIIHQSKLLGHFKGGLEKDNLDKDLESLFKKIKKDKKYFFSTKDLIMLESLKSDGIKFPKKYENIYEAKNPNIPYDIQILINKEETGLALLRLVQIIGEDKINDIGAETLYFIVSVLNQLDLDKIRNKLLLKVLPLKV